MRANLVRKLTAVGAALAMFSGVAGSAAAATRGYVLSYFIPAMYNVSDDECPHGKNVDSIKLAEQVLKGEGKTDAEIKAGTDADKLDMYKFGQFSTFRGQINGEPADVYLHPLSHTESMEVAAGKFGIGFNLDGTNSPDKFTDPMTGETGVNNQLARILGCYNAFRGTPESRTTSSAKWSGLAWLIAVDGADDMRNADNVEVRILRSLQTASLGLGIVQPNVTYTVDSTDPRLQNNVFHGRIKDGVFVSNEPVDFFMIASSGRLTGSPTYGLSSGGYDDLKRSHLRLTFAPDGSVLGFLGGFEPIKMLYAGESRRRGIGEFDVAESFPAFYQAMLRMADTDIDKDPQTGMRTRISATHQFGAVPAFLRFLNKLHTS